MFSARGAFYTLRPNPPSPILDLKWGGFHKIPEAPRHVLHLYQDLLRGHRNKWAGYCDEIHASRATGRRLCELVASNLPGINGYNYKSEHIVQHSTPFHRVQRDWNTLCHLENRKARPGIVSLRELGYTSRFMRSHDAGRIWVSKSHCQLKSVICNASR